LKEMENFSSDLLLSLYRQMVRIRLVEEKLIELHPEQEMRSPLHLYIGEEAIAVGVCANLARDDYTLGTYRGHGLYVARGGDLGAMMAELYGKADGCAGGRGGSMHMVDPENGLLGCSAIVGGTIPLAVGAALAGKMRDDGRVAAVFFGDGAADEGVFFESVNFAAVKRLPVLFVCENNGYATHSPQWVRQPQDNIFQRVEAWGVPGVRLDGNDVLAVYQAAHEAVDRARRGEGPTLLECRTYRWKEHVGPNPDFRGYRSEDELREWMRRCPIAQLRGLMLARRLASDEELVELAAAIRDEVEEAVEFGRLSPFPSVETLEEGVYA
jgi:TPP-dependent pyruvate/acetoin dehydrogenase alpha subunit